jgi:hypothetical protein
MLTEEQVAYYRTFGFLVLRELFTPGEIEILRNESDRLLRELRGGAEFDGKQRQAAEPFFERSPDLIKFMEDDRIHFLGEDLLGPGYVLVATEANLHVGDTQWHGGHPVDKLEPVQSIKIAFYLEPTTKDTGALRVVPGSHMPEFRSSLAPLEKQYDDPKIMPFGIPGNKIPSFALETQPGDVVVFPESLWHAAFGGPPGRSQHAINFMSNPVTEEQVRYIKELYSSFQISLHPPISLIRSENPRLRGMVERLVELGFEPNALG